MDISDVIKLVNIEKFKASILSDLIDGDLLDTIYFAVKPSILKALKEATTDKGVIGV